MMRPYKRQEVGEDIEEEEEEKEIKEKGKGEMVREGEKVKRDVGWDLQTFDSKENSTHSLALCP